MRPHHEHAAGDPSSGQSCRLQLPELKAPWTTTYAFYGKILLERIEKQSESGRESRLRVRERAKHVADFVDFVFETTRISEPIELDRLLREQSGKLLNHYFLALKERTNESNFNAARSTLLYDFYPAVSERLRFSFDQARLTRALPTWSNKRRLPVPQLIDHFEQRLSELKGKDGKKTLTSSTILAHRKLAWGFVHWTWGKMIEEDGGLQELAPEVQRRKLLEKLRDEPIRRVEHYCEALRKEKGHAADEGSRSVLYKWFYPFLTSQGLVNFDRERVTILPDHMYLPETPTCEFFQSWTDFLRDRVTKKISPPLSGQVATKYRNEIRKFLEYVFEQVSATEEPLRERKSAEAETLFAEIIRLRFGEFARSYRDRVIEQRPSQLHTVNSILDMFDSVILRNQPFVSNPKRSATPSKSNETQLLSQKHLQIDEPPPRTHRVQSSREPVNKPQTNQRSSETAEAGSGVKEGGSRRSNAKAQQREKVLNIGQKALQALQDECGLSQQEARAIDFFDLEFSGVSPTSFVSSSGKRILFSPELSRLIRTFIEGGRLVGEGQVRWNSANLESPLFYFAQRS